MESGSELAPLRASRPRAPGPGPGGGPAPSRAAKRRRRRWAARRESRKLVAQHEARGSPTRGQQLSVEITFTNKAILSHSTALSNICIYCTLARIQFSSDPNPATIYNHNAISMKCCFSCMHVSSVFPMAMYMPNWPVK
jgi:hypothetical protein